MKTSVTDLTRNCLLFFSELSPFTKPTFDYSYFSLKKCKFKRENKKNKKKVVTSLRKIFFKICDILYQFINESLCIKKSPKRIKERWNII